MWRANAMRNHLHCRKTLETVVYEVVASPVLSAEAKQLARQKSEHWSGQCMHAPGMPDSPPAANLVQFAHLRRFCIVPCSTDCMNC